MQEPDIVFKTSLFALPDAFNSNAQHQKYGNILYLYMIGKQSYYRDNNSNWSKFYLRFATIIIYN